MNKILTKGVQNLSVYIFLRNLITYIYTYKYLNITYLESLQKTIFNDKMRSFSRILLIRLFTRKTYKSKNK